jgi:hypothetical protein
MSALNFPASPVDGEFYEGYIYNESKNVWNSAGAAEPGPAGPPGPTGPAGSTGLEVIESIPGEADLNDYTTSGFYSQKTNSGAQSGTNYPLIPPNIGFAYAGLLRVINDGSNIYQEYSIGGISNGQTYWRAFFGNLGWTPWQTFATAGHIHDDLYFTKLQSDIRYWV